MTISFDLSPEQMGHPLHRAGGSRERCSSGRRSGKAPDGSPGSFVATRPAYLEAHKLGLVTGFLPEDYGGSGPEQMVDAMVVIEELAAVDPGFNATIG